MIRLATLDDLEILIAHRRAMFEDMHYGTKESLDTMSAAFRGWLIEEMSAERYFAWLKVIDGEIAGGAGAWLIAWPPTPADPLPQRAMILNVYTNPEHRRKGVARELMAYILEWCRARGLHTVTLHASNHGRHLYESLGFTPTNEMRRQGL